MRITLQSVGKLITIGTETLSSKLSGLEKPSLNRSKILVDLITKLAEMLEKAPEPINKFVFILNIFGNVIEGKQINKQVLRNLLGLIPVVLNLSEGGINGQEIVKRVFPVIDVYDEVNVFMREYAKNGFKF